MGIIERYKIQRRRNRFIRKPHSDSENIECDIRDILLKICPAFIHSNTGLGAIWHKCLCKDMRPNATPNPIGDEEVYDNCVCVWHHSDTCHRGKWSELEFLNKEQ